SGGPSPPVTACRRSSPVSTYRLVKVSVNPAGRFGAPETEPGPSGVAGEVMRISFHAPYWRPLPSLAAECPADNPPETALLPTAPIRPSRSSDGYLRIKARHGPDSRPASRRPALLATGRAGGGRQPQNLSGSAAARTSLNG